MTVDVLIRAADRAAVLLEGDELRSLVLGGIWDDSLPTVMPELRAELLCGQFHLRYRNKVAIFTSLQELITVVIESEEIAEAERQKFDMLWNAMAR